MIEHGSAVRRADRAVEWLAIAWLVTSQDRNTANPQLLGRLNRIDGVFRHRAVHIVGLLREQLSRDELIKLVVIMAYCGTDDDELSEILVELWAALQELDASSGAQLDSLFAREYQQANAALQPMIEGLDTGADLSALVGQPLTASVHARPSLFLPAPQAGRHGVLLEFETERVVHMYFGFPLQEPPERYMISRRWVRGGGWHYLVRSYLDGVWPAVAEQLVAMPELEHEFCRALGSSDDAWPEPVLKHVDLALRGLLDAPRGVPPQYINLLARAHGLIMFDWFVDWIREQLRDGEPLSSHWQSLPAALLAQRAQWQAIADANRAAPRAINLLLISTQRKPPYLVVADDWPDELLVAIQRGWTALSASMLRHRAWLELPARDTRPVVAFGTPSDNPLVAQTLRERGLELGAELVSDPTIVALSQPDDGPWRIAVAVSRPELAALIKLEMATSLTCSHAVFSRSSLVKTADLEQLLESTPHSNQPQPNPGPVLGA